MDETNENSEGHVTRKEPEKPWHTDASLLVGVASGAAFLVGHGYEVGFAESRGIPEFLVSVRPESIATALLALVVVGAFLASTVVAARRIKRMRNGFLAMGVIVGLVGVIYLAGGGKEWWWTALCEIEAVAYIVAGCRGVDFQLDDYPRLRRIAFSMLLVSIGYTSAQLTGLHSARWTRDFLTYESTSETSEARHMVVVRTYGTIFVAMEHHAGTDLLGPEWEIEKLEEFDKPLVLRELGVVASARPAGSW